MGEGYAWNALSPVEARDLFADFASPWWIAGGWAIDLHLGRQTRHHEDLDIAILRGDETSLPPMMPGWEIAIAHSGAFIAWDGERPLDQPYHQFWVRREPEGPWTFEVLLEDHDRAGTWRYRRDGRVSAPLERFGRLSPDGIPYLAPEVALLYKASRSKASSQQVAENDRDFASALPSLQEDARSWLRAALETAHPGHPWLAQLGPTGPML